MDALNIFIDTLDTNATKKQKLNNATFTLYDNKILILDNTLLFKLGSNDTVGAGDAKMFYLPVRTLNFLSSADVKFTDDMDLWIHNQIKKSILISGEAEKIRNQFIYNYKKKIAKVQKIVSID